MQATKICPTRASSSPLPEIVLPLLASSTATMSHNSRKKRAADERRSQRNSVPEEQAPVSEQISEYPARDRQSGKSQVPFYDDSNHVAYGWQQMSVLPDMYNLVGGTANDPPISPRSRPQTWPIETPSDDDRVEPSGFNPHPGRGQGPRRPRPLTEFEVVPYSRGGKRRFTPFVDPPQAEQEDANAGADDVNNHPAPLALAPKDVNQKLGDGQSQYSPSLKLTDGHRERSQPLSSRLMVDELEKPREAGRGAERMVSLHEEPAPLKIRKKRADKARAKPPSTLDQAHMLRAEQQREPALKKDEGVALPQARSENESMESLMAAITEQLSAFTVRSESQFEHRSAVPKPLNLKAIEATKEKRRRAALEDEADDSAKGDGKGRNKLDSVESFATGTSSEFENLSIPDSSEHNGAKRKWYKGFLRSE